jgi:hypothetical protein
MNKDIIDELLDDDAFDPKKLFDEKEYNTLIIDREGFNKKQNQAADLLVALMDPKITRPESEEIFKGLKEAGAQQLLADTIQSVKTAGEKAILTAACWESGLDFTGHYLFFVALAGSDDFRLAMEALTVVENCEDALDEKTINQALTIARSSKSANATLKEDLIAVIKSRLA